MFADNTVIHSDSGDGWKRASRGGGMLWGEVERKSVEVRQTICMQKRDEEESAGWGRWR